jgi:HEAT repeat protein
VGELLSALQSQHQAVRQYAAHRLAELDPEKINGLQLDLRDFEVLGQLLEEGDAPVRRDATGFIAALEPGPHRAALVMEALEDEDPQVVVNAINAVTPATGLAAVRRLGTLLKSSPHADVREAAANAMGKVGDRESVPALVAALDDSAENVRWFAVESLRKLGAKEAVPALQEVLKEDDSARVREIAASALGALGQPGSIPALRDALDDPNERVQQKASAALLALAKDDYDSMALVADVFAERDLLVPSAQVLGRIIEQFSDKEGMDERVARAYAKLADILQRQEDWAGAARALEKLMTLKPDDQAVHGQYVAALIQAGETARVVASFEKRLAAAADPVPVVSRALDAVELMIAAEKTEDARKLLEVAARSLGEEAPEDVQTRLEQLKTRLEAPAVE